MLAITQAKNNDYTAGSENPFANFEFTETMTGVDSALGVFVRLGDKMARVKSLIRGQQAQVQDEKIEDTLLDAANYCLLLIGLLESKKPHVTTTENDGTWTYYPGNSNVSFTTLPYRPGKP